MALFNFVDSCEIELLEIDLFDRLTMGKQKTNVQLNY